MSINSIKILIFVMKKQCVYCKVGTESLNTIYVTSSFKELWVSYLTPHFTGFALKNV
jgi:hypothetical protein